MTDERALDDLRSSVRAFLASRDFTPAVDSWHAGWDEDFTRALAGRGWVGMTIPEEYGGAGRTFMERFVVTEELLAAGAPVAAHWIADRQTAPSLLALRHRGAEAGVPAGDRAGRVLLRHRHERAGLRLGPGERAHHAPSAPTAAGS